jgi:hypothetical protein
MLRLPFAFGALLLFACACGAQLSTVTSGSALDASASTPSPRSAPQAVPSASIPAAPATANAYVIDRVNLAGVPARLAFQWLSQSSGLNIVIDWNALQAQGLDPQTPITLELRSVSFQQVLDLLVQQLQRPSTPNEAQLVYEEFPGFIQLLTKAQANQRLTVRIYEIAEVTASVPTFRNAPRMDLASVLESSGSTGGGVAFEQQDQDKPTPTQADRGEQVAEMIRNVIEPSVWQQNGGPASLRYFQGRLIVNAPMYVHRQIDGAVSQPAADPSAGRYVGYNGASAYTTAPVNRLGRIPGAAPVSPPPNARPVGGIGGIDRTPARPIAGRES